MSPRILKILVVTACLLALFSLIITLLRPGKANDKAIRQIEAVRIKLDSVTALLDSTQAKVELVRNRMDSSLSKIEGWEKQIQHQDKTFRKDQAKAAPALKQVKQDLQKEKEELIRLQEELRQL